MDWWSENIESISEQFGKFQDIWVIKTKVFLAEKIDLLTTEIQLNGTISIERTRDLALGEEQ